jgi:hypothetical protein
MNFFGLWSMCSEISNTFFSASINGLPDLVASHTELVSLNFWISCRTALQCGTLVSRNCAWNRCWTSYVYSPPHWNTCSTRNVHSSTDSTIITTHFFLASLLGSIWLLGSRPPGLGDTRLTLTPSVISNSNYIIMVGDWNSLKYCIFACFLYCNRQVHKDFLITRYYHSFMQDSWQRKKSDLWNESEKGLEWTS